MATIVHKELSYRINKCIFDVHNRVGPGVREECYQDAMEVALARERLAFAGKPRTRRELIYLGSVADVFEPDLMVHESVILELKAQREGFCTANFRQIVSYLKCCECSLGLLVNFASARAVIKRVVFSENSAEPDENYDAVRDVITPEVRHILQGVRDVLLDVHRTFGLGYSDRTYRNLIRIGCENSGLSCEDQLVVNCQYDGRQLPRSPITPLAVAGLVLVEVEAVQETVTARAIRTMQTHLQMTAAVIGIVVNFGTHGFQIRGVRPLKEPPA